MFFTLNELSFIQAGSKDEAINIMVQFGDVCKALFAAGFTSARIWDRGQLLGFQIAENFRVVDWLKSREKISNRERLSIQSLRRLIDKTSMLNFTTEQREEIDNCPIIAIVVNGEQIISCPAIKIGCVQQTLVVSLPTHPKWATPYLEVIYLDDDGEQKALVNHACSVEHLGEHQRWMRSLVASRKLLNDWRPSELPFPNLAYSNECAKDQDWANFQKERIQCTSDGQRLGLIHFYGKEVATRNRYQYDSRISALNTTSEKKRVIYGAGFGRDRIYLSVDFEKGGFEMCDYKGEHLGEYFFDGTKTSNALADHGIKVKS